MSAPRWHARPRNWALTAAACTVMVCGAIWPAPIVGAGGALVATFAIYIGIRQIITEHRAGKAAADAAADLTADEARALADDLSLQLYRAQDAIAFVAEMCDLADEHRGRRGEPATVTTVRVREWLKGARCARQAGLVLGPDRSGPDPDAVRTDPDTPAPRAADQPGHDPDTLRNRIAAALKWPPTSTWEDLIEGAAATERDATSAEQRLEETRRQLADARAAGMREAAALLRRTPRDSRDWPAALTGARVIETWLGDANTAAPAEGSRR